jgi:hypothetical protein
MTLPAMAARQLAHMIRLMKGDLGHNEKALSDASHPPTITCVSWPQTQACA